MVCDSCVAGGDHQAADGGSLPVPDQPPEAPAGSCGGTGTQGAGTALGESLQDTKAYSLREVNTIKLIQVMF